MLPLSSTALLRTVHVPLFPNFPEYVQFFRPLVGCQVFPESKDTSTAPTTPPASSAVPAIVTGVPAVTLTPEAGDVIFECGGVLSADAVASFSPAINVAG